MRQPPIESCVGPYPRAITDADVAQVAKWATTEVPMAVSTKQCATVMRAVGRSATYEPFRDWLESLPPWDGIARAGMWLITCAGAVDSQYTREVSLRWLLQAVWRTYVPGSQADYVLILEGPQGIRKSTLLAALVPSEIYFVDHVPKIGTKDAAIALLGPVIVEIAELSALRRTESEAMKAFLTTKYDSIRLPYDKLNTMLPRRCVIAGTTNDDAYLRDATGNRRYWPVSVTSCDPILLAANRDQLWAELVARYKAGDRCYLDGPTEALAVVEQEGRYESDSWHDPIVAWLARATAQQVVRVADDGGFPLIVRRDQIYQHALLIGSRDRWTQATDKRLAAVMRTLGYLSSPITIDGVKTRAYVRS
jgi:predicted P-loop ATPase